LSRFTSRPPERRRIPEALTGVHLRGRRGRGLPDDSCYWSSRCGLTNRRIINWLSEMLLHIRLLRGE
jgi:hypothetical protein